MTPLDMPLAGLVLLLRIAAAQPFTMPAGSMAPTLEVGDYFVASKAAYGYGRFSLPLGEYLPAFHVLLREPERGDVIVFRLPEKTSVDYVKRVIGLPGDRVQVVNGVLNLNGRPVALRRNGSYSDKTGDYVEVPVFEERLPSGKSYAIMELTDTSEGDETREFLVPPDHCFVMGDNRDNSNDSRYIGYVPYANIVGKALFVVERGGERLKVRPVR